MKIRVMKRREPPKFPNSPPRDWLCSATPEDQRPTCWPTWDEAMWWATMDPADKVRYLDNEARMEGGW